MSQKHTAILTCVGDSWLGSFRAERSEPCISRIVNSILHLTPRTNCSCTSKEQRNNVISTNNRQPSWGKIGGIAFPRYQKSTCRRSECKKICRMSHGGANTIGKEREGREYHVPMSTSPGLQCDKDRRRVRVVWMGKATEGARNKDVRN